LDDCSAQVFPYNIFAYCSICRVDCKFAEIKKKLCFFAGKLWNHSLEHLDSHNSLLVIRRRAEACVSTDLKNSETMHFQTYIDTQKTNSVAPRANYTDRATATCRRS
jgi:hypothetical protein